MAKKKKEPPVAIHGFKGFDKNLQCRGFQFKEGETYKHDGPASACNSGFHFCENPVDVYRYYAPGKGSKFHIVEGRGQYNRHNDSKIACTEIEIKAKISLADMINLGVKYIWKAATDKTKPTSGYSSSAATSGDCSPAICSGLNSKAKAGKYSCIALAWWNDAEKRGEMRCAETGCGDGSDGKLKAEVWYKLNESGQFVEV